MKKFFAILWITIFFSCSFAAFAGDIIFIRAYWSCFFCKEEVWTYGEYPVFEDMNDAKCPAKKNKTFHVWRLDHIEKFRNGKLDGVQEEKPKTPNKKQLEKNLS